MSDMETITPTPREMGDVVCSVPTSTHIGIERGIAERTIAEFVLLGRLLGGVQIRCKDGIESVVPLVTCNLGILTTPKKQESA